MRTNSGAITSISWNISEGLQLIGKRHSAIGCAAPNSNQILDTDGDFCGDNSQGRSNCPGFGTTFRVRPTGTLTVRHRFDGTIGKQRVHNAAHLGRGGRWGQMRR